MTRLEDALRATLAADRDGDTTPDLDHWLPGIRRGARRRRAVRQAVAAGVAATVALGAVVGYAVARHDDAPPAPTERHLGTPSPPPWSPRGMDVVGDALYVLDADPRCECTHLLRTTGTTWTELGRIPVWGLSSLDFTSDGHAGWVGDLDRVWVTEDQGRSWSPVPLPGAPATADLGAPIDVSVLADEAWAVSQDGVLWRLPDATSRPERVDIDGIGATASVHAVGDILLVAGYADAGTDQPTVNPVGPDVLRVSRDGGTRWTDLAAPCGSANITTADGAAFAVCRDTTGEQASISRWLPGQDRFEQYTATALSETGSVIALDDERLAVTDDADERIVTATTDIATDLAQSQDIALLHSAVLGDRYYVVSLVGMSTSDDGGRTWTRVSQ
ncbi:hypothetical protein [Pimelobacter simplex]|uniref:hypothetical protein n=1 Tax=Nocardioides simplex TaxID=2045 RepID=UPI003AACCF8E